MKDFDNLSLVGLGNGRLDECFGVLRGEVVRGKKLHSAYLRLSGEAGVCNDHYWMEDVGQGHCENSIVYSGEPLHDLVFHHSHVFHHST